MSAVHSSRTVDPVCGMEVEDTAGAPSSTSGGRRYMCRGRDPAVEKSVSSHRVIAEVLPADKARVVERLRQEGKAVAMVGDGVNDAPALATADIGVAIGSGSDVAKETGGIVLVRDDVRDVVAAIRLSRATMRKIKQNLFWAFVYNGLGVPVAALGFLNPIIAAAAMALSSLSVIANSAMLKRLKLRGGDIGERQRGTLAPQHSSERRHS